MTYVEIVNKFCPTYVRFGSLDIGDWFLDRNGDSPHMKNGLSTAIRVKDKAIESIHYDRSVYPIMKIKIEIP